MADTKITALAAITTVDPAADVLPIVDISDTSMAASGTTKKITSNQILGAGGTATLASATITGAATVGTTLGVTGVSTFAAGTALLPALTTTGDTNTGIYYPAADTFAVTTGGSERLRIDASGNCGIGVTPSAWSSSFKALQIGNQALWSVAGGNGYLSNNTTFNTSNAYVYRNNGFATEYIQSATNGVHAWFNAPSGTAGNAITFTQAMTLDASGNLNLGDPNGNVGRLFLRKDSLTDTVVELQNEAATGKMITFHTNGFTQVGSISFTNSAVAYNTSSDYRLKESVKPISGGLARVNALKPSVYKWKVDGSNGEGFIAHELAETVPLAVTGEKDAVDANGKPAYQGVDLSKIVPILVAAIQELTARVQTLETR